jgi:hypothetical protein
MLVQRNEPPLHSSVVASNQAAIAIAGHPGAGKSTLSLTFRQRGCQFVSDDLGAITVNDSNLPLVHYGIPYIKLRKEMVDHFGVAPDSLSIVPGDEDKYQLLVKDFDTLPPRLLRAVFVLGLADIDRPVITSLSGAEKFRCLLEHFRGTDQFPYLSSQEAAYRHMHRIAQQVRVYQIVRPIGGLCASETADLIWQTGFGESS